MSETSGNHQRTHTANFPLDAHGKPYHIGVGPGEVANRIVTVGDDHRALRLATMLDSGFKVTESKRKYTVVTGTFRGTPISIIAIGMGMPVADIMVREVRAIVNGPIHIVRFGSCGSISSIGRVGNIAVATDGAVQVTRNVDAFEYIYQTESSRTKQTVTCDDAYLISKKCPADPQLSKALVDALSMHIGKESIITGLNATCDFFYASQGRPSEDFVDHNNGLIQRLMHTYPECITLEMETFSLLHLAQCSISSSKSANSHRHRRQDHHGTASQPTTPTTPPSPLPSSDTDDDDASRYTNLRGKPSIRAAACAMVFANRLDNTFISPNDVDALESRVGLAILEAITTTPLDA